ncbi:Hypothetical predicted protein [Lecanosticta acicola]|uniref:Uncharacterized protein n=1 Tax=Lecanosticta acicola TaxID=111012 RepID=A0AAI9EBF3_9PEZI|nr:Hypothetical predicted protein [Lecanosticta acicola]
MAIDLPTIRHACIFPLRAPICRKSRIQSLSGRRLEQQRRIVITTKRRKDSATTEMLQGNGSDHVVFEDGWLTSERVLERFPRGTSLTVYGERTFEPKNLTLDQLVQQIENGSLIVKLSRVFHMDRIVEAHECLENNEGLGKIVERPRGMQA